METKKQLIDSVPTKARIILDLGAGTGLELTFLYSEKDKDIETTAIDISPNMLGELKKRPFGNKVSTICGDFFEVEFGDHYDAVISTSALHHFLEDDKLKLYKKVYASLRENGVFLNSDKMAKDSDEEASLLEDYYRFKDERPHCDTPLTVEKEKKLLEQVGFRNIETFETKTDNYTLIKAKK